VKQKRIPLEITEIRKMLLMKFPSVVTTSGGCREEDGGRN